MRDLNQESSGLLLVDKPAGVTSHDVVARVRRSLLRAFPEWDPRRRSPRGRKGPRPPRFKCGHAGTLDPMATGLMMILVGKGSRLSPFLMGMDKIYEATLTLGAATDTLDAEGQITATAPLPAGPESLLAALPEFRGEILQVPPAVSALKHEGTPLYKLVRQGKPLPELKARPVTIHELELAGVRWEEGAVDLRVSCSSGTYVRSLARDLAQAAGSEGHLSCLRRTHVGPFDVADSLPGIMGLDGEAMARHLVPLADGMGHRPALEVDEIQADSLRHGGQPDLDWLDGTWLRPFLAEDGGTTFSMLDAHGRLVAVGNWQQEQNVVRCAAVIPAEPIETKELGT